MKLSNIHSSKSRAIHLCNNSLQKHTEGFGGLDFAPECMWTSATFIEHLKQEVSAWYAVRVAGIGII